MEAKRPHTGMSAMFFAAILLVAAGVVTAGILVVADNVDPGKSPNAGGVVVDKKGKKIIILAVAYPLKYPTSSGGIPYHHAITWAGGRAGGNALFRTAVSDKAVYEALRVLGAEPGDNVTNKSWTERFNENHPDPDIRTEGSLIAISVFWEGLKRPFELYELFVDGAAGTPIEPDDMVIRFSGNLEKIPVWNSGCITCLCSCPVAKTSNASYTFRDYVHFPGKYALNRALIPAEGTPVTIELRLVER